MSKQVKGFLAPDGTFFERAPECMRYESLKNLERVCDSHGTSFENFLICLNAWHKTIKEYYDADSKCKTPEVGKKDTIQFNGADDRESVGPSSPAFLRDEDDNTDSSVRDPDAPGFLEQSIRGYK